MKFSKRIDSFLSNPKKYVETAISIIDRDIDNCKSVKRKAKLLSKKESWNKFLDVYTKEQQKHDKQPITEPEAELPTVGGEVPTEKNS